MTWKTRQRFDQGDLAAIVAGAGPQVLMIHGVGLRAEAWGAQIDALAESFAVKAVDMPGHGGSLALPGQPGLADFSDAVAAVLEGPTVVMGHSFGAMIALDLAIRHPEKVRGVAALNAIYSRSAAAREAVLARAASLDGQSMADPTGPLERWFGTEASPERAACHDWLCSVDPQGYRAAYRVFAAEDGPAAHDLKALRCPALFLTGGQEPNSTPSMSHAMADLAPLGQAEVIQDAAHMMPMTHADEVSQLLFNFAQRCPL